MNSPEHGTRQYWLHCVKVRLDAMMADPQEAPLDFLLQLTAEEEEEGEQKRIAELASFLVRAAGVK